MGHWFDDLARPRTRRAALKGAGIAGAALLLPIGRLQVAHADVSEPCFKPCADIARARQELADEACAKRYGVAGFGESTPVVGGLFKSLRRSSWIECRAQAATTAHASLFRCHNVEDCGDPASYPNGAAPTPAPPPGGPECGEGKYAQCGDQPCCDLSIASCVSCNGRAICCRNGGGGCCG